MCAECFANKNTRAACALHYDCAYTVSYCETGDETDLRRCCCRRGCVRCPDWTDCVVAKYRQTSSTGRHLERGSPSNRPAMENAEHTQNSENVKNICTSIK